jgi:hypothetical protein
MTTFEQATLHTVSFERNTRTEMWRGMCDCGWCRIGPRDEVQALAATHDIEWQPVKEAEVA